MVSSTEQTEESVRTYDVWLEGEGVPVHKGYYIEDARTLDLGPWARRECNAAFLELAGQEGVAEAHIIELAPGQTLPPFRIAVDEVLYVIEGNGLTQIWSTDDAPKKTFEWQKHSMFYVPPNYTYQLTNMQGNRPTRLMVFSSLPLAMHITPDPDFFFKNPYANHNYMKRSDGDEYYSEAKALRQPARAAGRTDTYERNVWFGSFFPDMRAWDRLDPQKGRGAGSRSVSVKFPGATTAAHMAVFPALTYKKAHRHGPAVVIIIPAGEGYSIMWPKGGDHDKVVVPWHEASIFVPPDGWFHQHFNVGGEPGRYLAMHPAVLSLFNERIGSDLDQIEYPVEDPFVRQYFEEQLAKRGLKSRMPEQAYKDPKFEWDYE